MKSKFAGAAASLALVAGLCLAPASASAAPAKPSPGKPAPSSKVDRATVTGRASYPAMQLQPGPDSAAAVNSPETGVVGPLKGQPIPGFSAMAENKDGTLWAMPDNGYGSKTNSADFLLRLYQVKPDFEKGKGNGRHHDGRIGVQRFLGLNDANHVLDFPIVNENTPDRLLTGADFDIESLVPMPDGTFMIGEEFGPFLLHFDAAGTLLSKPTPLPGHQSPQNPHLQGEPTVLASSGFEAMWANRDKTRLYPVIENALPGDTDKRRRWIHEFDVASNSYTGKKWAYQADRDADLAGDAYLGRDGRPVILERDNFDGEAAVVKRLYTIDLDKIDSQGFVTKELHTDLLDLANPDRIGAGAGWGTGDPYKFGFVSVEVALELRNGRLLVANDNNFPFDDARNPGRPDDVEIVQLDSKKTKVASNPNTVISHRGASGYRPEHTFGAYEQAIGMCADYIEPDLVSTKDGVLVDRHENEIGGTTDVASHPEFADRKTTKVVDGSKLTGWFTEDFTLAELKTLKARERLPKVRPGSAEFDGLYEIPTFAEVVDFARHSRTCDGKQVGVAPEIKHGTYFDGIGLSMEDKVVAELDRAGLTGKDDPALIQSFETQNLIELNDKTDVKLAQLVNCSGAPADFVAAGDPRTWADLMTPEGLKWIGGYADQAALCKDVMIPKDKSTGALLDPSPTIGWAHEAGMEVVGWTFRAENQFLPLQYKRGTDPNAHGDLRGEICTFLRAGMDVVFSDQPDIAVDAVHTCRR